MIEKVNEVYNRINNEFLSKSPFGDFNDKKFRIDFIMKLENEIINSVIKCDEENNPPEVIDFGCVVAKVFWVENNEQKYCNLVFGQPEQVMVIQQKLLMN